MVGPPLGTSLLSRPRMLGKFMAESPGLAGIWGVISACVVMDVILLACLQRWSGKQETQMNTDECIGLTKVEDDANNDHDHSDKK